MRTPRTLITVYALLCAFFWLPAIAQDTGKIVGSISDTSGAVIPGATVNVSNIGTNQVRTFTTNEQGRFTANDLLPGEYRLEAESQGFKRYVQTGITVRVGDSIDVPVRMELGTASESVTITGETPLLQTTNSSVGEVIERQLVADLPLNERQAFSLVILTPGVTAGRQISNAAQPFNRAPNFSVSGGRGDTNEILLDGTPNTVAEGSTGAFRAVTIFPTVEGTQEFKVQSNTYAAEFGGSGGGVVNIVTKTGTNSLHGAMFEFLRNSDLDSNSFFSNARNVPLASFKRNQFGAAVGGPIYIPKLYNGRDKTFFFVSWESLIQRGGLPFTTSVPTDLQRAGDFSQTYDAKGNQVIIYDPNTTTYNAATGAFTRTPFANNTIPANRINPVAANFIKLFPEPTDLGVALTHASNFNKTLTQPIDDHRIDIRGDQNVGANQRLFASYAQDRRTWQYPNAYGTIGDPAFRTYPSNPTSVKFGYMNAISATWVGEFRYAYNHLYFAQQPGSTGYDITQLGFPQSLASQVQSKEFPRLVFSDLTGTLAGLGHTSNTMHGDQNSNIFGGSISRVTGNHTLKFGTQVRRDYANRLTISPGDLGFVFARTYTQGPNALVASTNAGSSVADALLGIPDTNSSSRLSLANPVIAHNWTQAYYVQDDWRVNQRLTINLGVRWDLQFPMVEEKNNFDWFVPAAASPIASQVPSLNLHGAVTFAGDNARNPYQTNMHDFAPRIGIAYKVTDKIVLRTAYGMFYAPNTYGTSANNGMGFSQSTPFVASVDGATPIATISNPFPNGLALPFGLGATPSANANLGLAMTYVEPKTPTPYVQQWNFALQRQIGQSWLAEARYAASKGTHLPDVGYYLTQLTPSQLGPQISQTVANPFYGIITVGSLANKTVRLGQLETAFPQYSSVGVQYPTAASSIYHSAQFKLEKRMAHDFTFLMGYTFSKLIDDNSGTMSWLEPATPHQNGYDREADRSVSDQDVSQRFLYSFSYGLPFGKGRPFGNNLRPIVNAFLGGWQITGIMTLQTGVPLALTTTDTSQSGGGVLRPNNNGTSAALSGSSESRLNQYFLTSVFSQPAPYTFGNTARTLPDVRGPGTHNLDFSLYKDLAFKERYHLQIRGEAFNLTNTPEFDNPDTNLQSPTFGHILTQRNTPRQLQVSMRFAF
ncbi:MAG TPA: TonB-dependent receptor [Bryobacteraceae bacterium]|nr:TonB-dependent receptor [Bryobacteraceae bacterium]